MVNGAVLGHGLTSFLNTLEDTRKKARVTLLRVRSLGLKLGPLTLFSVVHEQRLSIPKSFALAE